MTYADSLKKAHRISSYFAQKSSSTLSIISWGKTPSSSSTCALSLISHFSLEPAGAALAPRKDGKGEKSDRRISRKYGVCKIGLSLDTDDESGPKRENNSGNAVLYCQLGG